LTASRPSFKAQRHQLALGNRLRSRVSDCARQAADGIDALDFGGRQRLVRLIVEEVRVDGWQIELRLRIPLDNQPEGDHAKAADDGHPHRRSVSSKDRWRSLGAYQSREGSPLLRRQRS
jgi:site-specific DNA recombinase